MKKHFTNYISYIFGKFASYRFPKTIQIFINKVYVSFMGVDMSEYHGIERFTTLNALFTRELKFPRDLKGEQGDFISPCDGLISEQGKIKEGRALQIKGSSYKVGRLLSDYVCKNDKMCLQDGKFINFYLSPKDYHRFHAPCDMKVIRAIQISGKLYPVNFIWLRKIGELFCENERVVLVCESKEFGRFYLVFVGALNVGKIAFIFDERVQTNAKADLEVYYDYKDVLLKKGDEIGRFEMGSTIVALFEDSSVELKRMDTKVRFGEVVASRTDNLVL